VRNGIVSKNDIYQSSAADVDRASSLCKHS
jgi:hypothetical protein